MSVDEKPKLLPPKTICLSDLGLEYDRMEGVLTGVYMRRRSTRENDRIDALRRQCVFYAPFNLTRPASKRERHIPRPISQYAFVALTAARRRKEW